MSDRLQQSRRQYLKLAGTAGALGITGLSGCVGSLPGAGGGPIPMGSILPVTGDLADFGPGMEEGVNLAVEQVNEAGGPLGREIEVFNRDSETVAQAAQETYSQLVSEQSIIGFVGAASSGVSVPLAQGVTADQVMQVSPASTSPTLADLGYDGDTKYFARTAPNDVQQGIVMGMILNDFVEADSAAFLHVNNAYGEGLAQGAADAFNGENQGLVPYSSQTTDYTSTLDELFSEDPDAVGFVGYPESGQSILQTWQDGGYGGQWALSEGLNSPDFFQELSDITDGMYVSSPDPEQTQGAQAFQEALGKEPRVFSPHSYDALFLMALAVHTAGEASGTAIAQNIKSVSGGDGETVTVGQFQRAKDILDDGGSVNYQGASSPVDMNENLEPLNRFAILQVQDGSTTTLRQIPRSEFM
jgi:branched-chain amino acid transport system substrate-binding protein